ncbi:MAG: hypothetical protein DRP71_10530 [Verrucomicrobia bacterium]|nr:MAG: hypothetical protein DRP71_10530 [Verrucomicrobiota bacterium]
MDNVVTGLNQAEKCCSNPVVSSSDPNDQPTLYGSVIHDRSEGFRMWHSTWNDHRDHVSIHHLVSDDGIHWVKPLYDDLRPDGRPSNAVFGSDIAPNIAELFSVLFDPFDQNPDRRFKLAYKYKEKGIPSPFREEIMRGHRPLLDDLKARGKCDLVDAYERVISDGLYLPTQRRAAGVAFSADGIHWNSIDPLAIPAIGDVSHLTWDPYRKRYLIYARDFFLPEDVHERDRGEAWYQDVFWGRAVRVYESVDFANWTAGEIVMHADIDDLPGDEIYSMAVFPYEGLYIGLVQVYHACPGTNTLEIQLAVSRDGVNWKRVGNRRPFIPLGDIGEWDRFNQSVGSAPVLVDDELRFYYTGRTYRHKPYDGADNGPQRSAIGFAGIPRDRFIYAGASFDRGTVTTVPMQVNGARLHLNADCAHGTILVRILSPDGVPEVILESDPVSIDSLDVTVDWSGNGLAKLDRDRPVRIQFELRNAKLYSFWAD